MIARVVAAVLGVGVSLATPASAWAADTDTGTVTVRTATEGWYTTNPSCAGPAGCVVPPAQQSPFPAGTMHVGIVGGQTDATSYLSFDLSAVPSGVTLTAGLLTIPLDTAAENGAVTPESSHVQACLVTGKVVDAEASVAAPPGSSCVISAPAVYRDAPAPALTIDVGPFLGAWSGGAAIALVPSGAAVEARETWRVVFSAKRRTPATPPAASVGLVYSSPPVPGPITGLPEPVAPAPIADPPLSSGGLVIPPGPVAQQQNPVPAPQTPPVAAPPITTPVVPAAALRRIDAPGQAWLLPLIALAGLIAAGRVLTRDLRQPLTATA